MNNFSDQLAEQGLNLQAVIPVSALPKALCDTISAAGYDLGGNKQLLFVGHAGRAFWQQLSAGRRHDHNPVDEFTRQQINRWFEQCQPNSEYQWLYPGHRLIPLQQLGVLAGWHFPSPFMVGVNSRWGSWYAYRAVILADTQFPETEKPQWHSPCVDCLDKPCIAACPASAVSAAGLDLGRCSAFRLEADSPCQYSCLARLSCPVGRQYKYSQEQIHYHYQQSLITLKEYGNA